MVNTASISDLIEQQRQFFATGITKGIDFRVEQLERLKEIILTEQDQILAALKSDLNKPEFEGFFELAVVREINYVLKKIRQWVKPKKVNTDLEQFPAQAKIYPEPLGIALIIGPWNYPFSLMISPLIGAIAAGNCAILKPSEFAPATSRLVSQLISKIYPHEYIKVIEGGVEVSQELLQHKFDHIFFTGGTRVGKIVMEAAAKNLTPVTLELGGKSPCIVDKEVKIIEAAKRITWGKFINTGQTCIAPDYLLVDQTIKEELITAIQICIHSFYGDNPFSSTDYGRIVNLTQFERLTSLLKQGKVITGGETSREDLYIAPTLIEPQSLDSPLMQEEIFGPILPVIPYQNLEEAIDLVNRLPKPLALYFFSTNRGKQDNILTATSSGGVGLNETILHYGVNELPFGGVGDSGLGSYRGKASFDTFSHYKSVLIKSFRFDINWRYAPYKGRLAQLKRLLR